MTEKKLTRNEQKARRELEKAFQPAFKQEAKAAGWGYLKPTSFKRIDEWFVSLNPVIWTDSNRFQLQVNVKPFMIDDLMSRIIGFEGLDGTHLSLRARGPHCLVTPMFIEDISSETDFDRMLVRSTEVMASLNGRIGSLSVNDFVEFAANGVPPDHVGYNHVAALILAERSEEALSLCERAMAIKQWGGPARVREDGQMIGFFELAAKWIRRTES